MNAVNLQSVDIIRRKKTYFRRERCRYAVPDRLTVTESTADSSCKRLKQSNQC